jgi:hypothetical protein
MDKKQTVRVFMLLKSFLCLIWIIMLKSAKDDRKDRKVKLPGDIRLCNLPLCIDVKVQSLPYLQVSIRGSIAQMRQENSACYFF